MNEFEKDCIEKIPPHEMRRINETVRDRVARIWGNTNVPLVNTTCDSCQGLSVHKRSQRCLCSVVTGQSICAECWARECEENLCREYLEGLERINRPKEPFPVAELKYGGLVPLDVADFAKI